MRSGRHARQPASTLITEASSGVDWSTVDRYGLVHLAEHAVCCGPEVADKAIELACGGLRRAVRASLGSDRHFLRLLDVLSERVINQYPLDTGLPAVLYLGVVRRQLQRGLRSLAPAVFGLLARLGRTEEALEHLAALPPSLHQFEAAMEIVSHHQPHGAELLELTVEAALSVPAGEIQRVGQGKHPLKRAAIHGDRAGAYLDLAARADAAEVPDLLRLAEESLPDASLADRLCDRARLVVAWAPIDPGAARRNLAASRAPRSRSPRQPAPASPSPQPHGMPRNRRSERRGLSGRPPNWPGPTP